MSREASGEHQGLWAGGQRREGSLGLGAQPPSAWPELGEGMEGPVVSAES